MSGSRLSGFLFGVHYRQQIEEMEERFRQAEEVRLAEQDSKEKDIDSKRRRLEEMQDDAEKMREEAEKVPMGSMICPYRLYRITI